MKRDTDSILKNEEKTQKTPLSAQMSNYTIIQQMISSDPNLKRMSFLSNTSYLQDMTLQPDSVQSANTSPIQLAKWKKNKRRKVDGKKEKWKSSGGKKGWKHGRKQNYDLKHPEFEPQEEEPKAIVSEFLKEGGFSELNYLDPVSLLYGYYWSSAENNPVKKAVDQYLIEGAEIEDVIAAKIDALLKDLDIEKCITEDGNCGALAKFLFDEEKQESPGNFQTFIQKLKEEISPGKIKLIRVTANIGHAFTIICHNQRGKESAELIQAWQDEYGVNKSLDSKAVYWVSDLIPMFQAMNNNITEKRGMAYFQELFLISHPKAGITHFEVEKMDCRILEESPEDYAARMLTKPAGS